MIRSAKCEWNKSQKKLTNKLGQPASPGKAANTIVLKTVVKTHKKEPNLKMRCSYVLHAPKDLEHLRKSYLVEYGGPKEIEASSLDDISAKHGNARKTKQDYVRNNPQVMKEVLQLSTKERYANSRCIGREEDSFCTKQRNQKVSKHQRFEEAITNSKGHSSPASH